MKKTRQNSVIWPPQKQKCDKLCNDRLDTEGFQKFK